MAEQQERGSPIIAIVAFIVMGTIFMTLLSFSADFTTSGKHLAANLDRLNSRVAETDHQVVDLWDARKDDRARIAALEKENRDLTDRINLVSDSLVELVLIVNGITSCECKPAKIQPIVKNEYTVPVIIPMFHLDLHVTQVVKPTPKAEPAETLPLPTAIYLPCPPPARKRR